MNRQLILVRHSLPQTRQDLPAREWHLSEEGRRRAERLAESLIHEQLDIIFTSPEPKARETAEILAQRYQLPVRIIEELHEHKRGSVPYLSQQEFEKTVCEFFERPNVVVFGIESADQAHERFSRAVDSILSQHDNSTIAIVAHGTVISLFVSRLTGQPGYQFWCRLGLPSFVVVDLQSKDLIALENIS